MTGKVLKRITSAIVSVTTAIAAFPAIPASAETGATTYTYSGYDVEYTVKSEWESGQAVEVKITNTGEESILNWAFMYDTAGEISGIWNADIYDCNETTYVVKNCGWNYEIQPEQSVVFGYNLVGSELTVPTAFELYSKRCDITEGYDVQLNITGEWETGLQGEIVLTNTSEQPIEAWELSFDSSFAIDNLWNGRITANEIGRYSIASQSWTNPIAAGESVTVGFTGSKTVGTETAISNYTLSSVVIGERSGEPEIPEKTDTDGDGLSDDEEAIIGTDPEKADTDGDGFLDYDEIYIYGTDPLTPNIPEEQEDDTLTLLGEYNAENNVISLNWYSQNKYASFDILVSEDNEEYSVYTSVTESAYKYSIAESFEIKYFKVSTVRKSGEILTSLPIIATRISDNEYEISYIDSDSDGLPDIWEQMYKTDVNKSDTDDDGLTDYQEIYLTNTDPLVYNSVIEELSDADADCDGDGLSNIDEITRGTDPLNADTDGDNLSDYDELYVYKTEPLVKDTDNDTLSDGDELKIGLDPTNPETFGVPDAEYKVAQTVSADSEAFSSINTADNPYKLSLEITAAGYVEGSIEAGTSGYAAALENDCMLGMVPELKYYNSESIESVKLIFEISDENIDNVLGIFPDSEEMEGIKRLNVFKYFEDLNMFLPIETKFDVDKNIMYTEVDELGTYCVMDMEMWFESLGILETEYEETENEPLLMSVAASSSFDDIVFDEEDTVLAFVGETVDTANNEEDDVVVTEHSISYESAASEFTTYDTPVDVVFILQAAGNNKDKYLVEKEIIQNVSDTLFMTYGSARVCIISYNVSNAQFLTTSLNNGNVWMNNSDAVSAALLTIGYKVTNEYCDRGAAFKKMLNEIVYRENSARFAFSLINGANDVKGHNFGGIFAPMGGGYVDQIKVCKNMSINYSEVMPTGYSYLDARYAQMVENAIVETNGMTLIIDDAETATMDVYEHIRDHVAPPEVVFRALVPTDWDYVELDSPLVRDGYTDTDKDGLTDWNEVRNDLLSWDGDGSVILPSISQCTTLSDKPYAVEGLTRYKNNLFKYHCNVEEALSKTYILPIASNPNEIDTDGDGYTDGPNDALGNGKINDPRPLICDVYQYNLNDESYVSIQSGRYYGGNQNWFGQKDTVISEGGCGLISACDLLFYLFKENDSIQFEGIDDKLDVDVDEYMKFVEDIGNKYLYPLTIFNKDISYILTRYPSLGILPSMYCNSVCRYFNDNAIDLEFSYVSVGEATKNEVYECIKKSLQENKPVPLFVAKDEWLLMAYSYNDIVNRNLVQFDYHWINITEIEYDMVLSRCIVAFSSWGKKGYFDLDDLNISSCPNGQLLLLKS